MSFDLFCRRGVASRAPRKFSPQNGMRFSSQLLPFAPGLLPTPSTKRSHREQCVCKLFPRREAPRTQSVSAEPSPHDAAQGSFCRSMANIFHCEQSSRAIVVHDCSTRLSGKVGSYHRPPGFSWRLECGVHLIETSMTRMYRLAAARAIFLNIPTCVVPISSGAYLT